MIRGSVHEEVDCVCDHIWAYTGYLFLLDYFATIQLYYLPSQAIEHEMKMTQYLFNSKSLGSGINHSTIRQTHTHKNNALCDLLMSNFNQYFNFAKKFMRATTTIPAIIFFMSKLYL